MRTRQVVGAGAAVLALVVALVGLWFLAQASLPERVGPPIEELVVEHTRLAPEEITLKVRNVGADPVTVAQVMVNDAYVDFDGPHEAIPRSAARTLTLKYPWQDGQPYEIGMLTNTGLIIEHGIDAAVLTPPVGLGLLGRMALLGIYVGLLPILLGMAFLPILRRAPAAAVTFVLAVTVGLLGFLAVDASVEALELAAEGLGAEGLGGAGLVVLGALTAFGVLVVVDEFIRRRLGNEQLGLSLALLVAIGIGLHNLGEGLAVGSAYAVGELALGAFLVVGFALHNTTEGVAIVAPVARLNLRWWQLAGLAAIAGLPTVLGAVAGATVSTPALSALLLSLGVGAIVQVIWKLIPSLRSREPDASGSNVIAGIVVGVAVMFGTSLLVSI